MNGEFNTTSFSKQADRCPSTYKELLTWLCTRSPCLEGSSWIHSKVRPWSASTIDEEWELKWLRRPTLGRVHIP